MADFEAAATIVANRTVSAIRRSFAQELSGEEREQKVRETEQEAVAKEMKPEKFGEKLSAYWQDNKIACISVVVLAVMNVMIIGAPLFAAYDPTAISLTERLQAPSIRHICGTDELGRDIFSRLLYGGRISLMVGLIPTTISLVIGVTMGLLAGFFRKLDSVIMRLADIVLAFPSILLAMVVMYTLGASTFNIFIALSVIGWAGTARIVRAQTLSLREMQFIEAAHGIGVKKITIMRRHILPNCLPSLIVLFTLDIPDAILSEANLSFLGVGAQPPDTSWGLMVSQAKNFASSSPWMLIFPSLAILIMVLALNFLGDGLRDAIDPNLKK